MARGAKDGEQRHREEQRVQAGDDGHSGDLRVPENFGNGQGRERDTCQQVAGYLLPAYRQHPAQDRPAPQPFPKGNRHRLTSPGFTDCQVALIMLSGGVNHARNSWQPLPRPLPSPRSALPGPRPRPAPIRRNCRHPQAVTRGRRPAPVRPRPAGGPVPRAAPSRGRPRPAAGPAPGGLRPAPRP